MEGKPAPVLKEPMMTRGEKKEKKGPIRKDQLLPAPLLLPGPPSPLAKPSLQETTFPKPEVLTIDGFTPLRLTRMETGLETHIDIHPEVVFLFPGIQLTPNVGPEKPSAHRHLIAIRQEYGAAGWQWVRGGIRPLVLL